MEIKKKEERPKWETVGRNEALEGGKEKSKEGK